MSTQDEEDREMEISTEDEAGGAKAPEQPATAQSSSATDVSNTVADDTADLVRDVVDQTRQSEEAAASSASEEGGEPPAVRAQENEQDDENYSDVPFNKHPRFQQVLGKLKTAEVNAERYRNVETYIRDQGLGAEEAADLLYIGGLIKTNPAKAWEQIKPTVEKLLVAAGEILPNDLRALVNDGQLTKAAAMEVSRSRALVTSTEAQRTFERTRADEQRRMETVSAVQSAVGTWESERRERDPNFDAKMPAIEREVTWLQAREGKPDTPKGVRDQLQKAYDNVVKSAPPAPVARQRPPVRPVTGGQVNGSARPKPSSTLDIINQVVAARA
jgi:hypothetical protein